MLQRVVRQAIALGVHENEIVSPLTTKRHGCVLSRDGAMRAASRILSMWGSMGWGVEDGGVVSDTHGG